MDNKPLSHAAISRNDFCSLVLKDYTIMVRSREISKLGRTEVLQGRASFGIFGDGKELPQVVMARYFEKGDFLSGYYRDQTFCFAKNIISEENYFSQIYADTEEGRDPCSSGRQMVSHFSTVFLDKKGNWLDLTEKHNVVANVSQTAGQLPRAIGLAYTSTIFRRQEKLRKKYDHISKNGNEVCFVTIGDGSTAEGHFWETVHTAAAIQVPLALFIWDDGYGISVASQDHLAKGSISEALKGMQHNGEKGDKGIDIYTIKGWDYTDLHQQIKYGIEKVRKDHIPAIFHIKELTQPFGHSTSGSHERYKSAERLKWEKEFDCNQKMREWILQSGIASEEELLHIEAEQKEQVAIIRKRTWENYLASIHKQAEKTKKALVDIAKKEDNKDLASEITDFAKSIETKSLLHRYEILQKTKRLQRQLGKQKVQLNELDTLVTELQRDNSRRYNTHLYTTKKSAAQVELIAPQYAKNAKHVSGYQILNQYFDTLFKRNDHVFAFGEDVGQIGDVNQGFSNLQDKYGKERIFDTGIRELTIIGQAMGMAMRGLKPIAEVQYLDYLLYALQPLSDDVATLHYRTAGIQSCPLIIRTRGHRLEGIWHSGSPMGMLLNSLKGIMIGVPRNMTQAAAMYNALLHSNDPGIIIESLNGYRLKEALPQNLSDIQVPFGHCEILRKGKDVTLVSYGSTLRIVEEVATSLHKEENIDCEVIDVQTIIPFDSTDTIIKSIKKTNRIVFIDEDYEGGFSAYMMNEIIERRGGFYHLDATPKTVAAKEHRTSYGRDGEYFSKPNFETIWDTVLQVVQE